jgi:hypothetical protein
MGILDDAIREHLELIRRRGAADSEVERLENEAFGPPTRPDEADFPDSDEAQAASGNGVATEAALEESPEESAAHEDVTTLLSATETGEEGSEPGTGLEEPTGAHIADEPESEGMLVEHEEEEPAAEQEEPAAEEHPIVEEPAPEQHEEPSEEGTPLYDHAHDELEIDLDLRLDDGAPATEPPSDELPVSEPPSDELEVDEAPSEEHAVAEPEGATPLEPPIESLDTVEHPFHEEIVEEEEEPHEEASPSDEYPVEDEAEPDHAEDRGEEEEDEEEEDEESDEDVLADTPEFLKDAPEDDELWFEQGKPKDFDF